MVRQTRAEDRPKAVVQGGPAGEQPEQPGQPEPAADLQLQAEPAAPLYEVLTEQPNGHRTVHRLRAPGRAAAEEAVTAGLDDGVRVIGAAVAGAGLGSGDPATF